MPTTVRRSFKARRVLTASAAVAAVGATAVASVQYASADEPTGESASEAQQTCVMEALPIPGGHPSARVTGMSDDGSVIAYYAEEGEREYPDPPLVHPLIYSDGEVVEVPMTGYYSQIADVNSSGDGAGFQDRPSGFYDPYVWRDGELSLLPGGIGQAFGINEQGDVVGEIVDEGTSAVIWPADGSGPVELPLPDYANWGTATDITDEGTVVGYITDEGDNSGHTKPYVWHADGTGAELPMPEGADRADAYSHPVDVTGDWVSGFLMTPDVDDPSETPSGVRWNLADGTAELTELGWWESDVAVSAAGTAVGQLHGTSTAAYQSGETVVELPGAVTEGNYAGDFAVEITADGSLIAGDVFVGDDGDLPYYNAVTWTCE